MKLSELAPRFWGVNGERLGMSFNCPHCLTTRLAIALHVDGHLTLDKSHIMAVAPETHHIWECTSEDFSAMTVSPSVDASAQGHWHGFIRAGNIE